MHKVFIFVLSVLFACPSVAFAQDHDWTGVYIGASVGVMRSNDDRNITYWSREGGNGFWENGMYGSRDMINSYYQDVQATYQYGTVPFANRRALSQGSIVGMMNDMSFNPITPWLEAIDEHGISVIGSAKAGFNIQLGPVVIGGEVDGSLVKHVAKTYFGIAEAASNTGDYSFCTGLNCAIYSAHFRGQYLQNGESTHEKSLEFLRTARGRLGVALGRALIYGTGGLAAANVSVSTASQVSEAVITEWFGGVSNVNDMGKLTQSKLTSWQGAESKTKYGYAVGGGISYALSDHLVVNVDGYYYNLGKYSLTATDNRGDTSYTISGRLNGMALRSGIELHF